jgi:hypothetical protein
LKVRRVFLVAIPKRAQQGYIYVDQQQVLEEAANYFDIVQV